MRWLGLSVGAIFGVAILHPAAALWESLAAGNGFAGVPASFLPGEWPLLAFHLLLGAGGGALASAVLGLQARQEIEAQVKHAQLEAQLLRAQKLESVGRLASGVAHDFNNLLSALRIQVALAKKKPEALEKVDGIIGRAGNLPKQLLLIARQEPGEPQATRVSDLVGGMVDVLERTLGRVTVERDLRAEGVVLVDPAQLEQVVLNLAVNAKDAMPEGGRLVVRTRDHQGVLMEFEDDGPGMDEKTLARIFDPFYTTKEDGSGLGLSTTMGIIKQAGGTLEVDSTPGQGTCFRIWFPATGK